MITSRKFKDTFDKAFNTFTELLLPHDELQQAYTESFNGKLSKEKCKSLRNSVTKCFKTSVAEEFNKLCEEFQVEEKLLIKQNLVKEQHNQPLNSGWRPTGNGVTDTFGDRRQNKINFIKNMKNLDSELEEQLKKSKRLLEKEHRMLQSEVGTCDE